jgi:uncharacterized membrane protein YgdD (TMEM256/DUF423 family)
MHKTFLVMGSLFAALGVILGAFGAHALKSRLSADQLQIFETGVRYQMYHAFALVFLFAIAGRIPSSLLNFSGILFIAGILLFSGSVYLLACRELLGIDSWKNFLGPITPLGGMCFVAGWISLLIAATKAVSDK